MTGPREIVIRWCHNAHADVAQLDRAPGFEPGGRGFESLRPHHKTTQFEMGRLAFLARRPRSWQEPVGLLGSIHYAIFFSICEDQ